MTYLGTGSSTTLIKQAGFTATANIFTAQSYLTMFAGGNNLIRAISSSNFVSSGLFTSANTYAYGYKPQGDNFFGIFNTVTEQVGWFKVSWLPGTDGIGSFMGQYETKGASVPEPGSLGLLALGGLAVGASGVRRLRRKSVQGDKQADYSNA